MAAFEETYARVKKVLVEALGADEDQVTYSATLQGDLGAESIDFLDIVFRLEREFEIKIPRGELFPDSILGGDTDLVQNGRVTDRGMVALQSRMPFADFTGFTHDRRLSTVSDLFTVELLLRYIEWKLSQAGQDVLDDRPAQPSWSRLTSRSSGSEGPPRRRNQPMESTGNLWAIGYDDLERADQVREKIVTLGWDRSYLTLEDVAVVVRHRDGTLTLNRQPYPANAFILGCTLVGFLAGLVTATPLTGAAIGAFLGGADAALVAGVGIDDQFIQDVEKLMKPGTSALFILEGGGDLDLILHDIRGLGGTILKTNVDLTKAKQIQAQLAAGQGDSERPG